MIYDKENGIVYGINEECKALGLEPRYLGDGSDKNMIVQKFCKDLLDPERMATLSEGKTETYSIDANYISELEMLYKYENFDDLVDLSLWATKKEDTKSQDENKYINVSLLEDKNFGAYPLRIIQFDIQSETVTDESNPLEEGVLFFCF